MALENECRYFAIVSMDVTSTDEAKPASYGEEIGRLLAAPASYVAAPTALITISCVDDSPADVSVYDAQLVCKSVTAKYSLLEEPAGLND